MPRPESENELTAHPCHWHDTLIENFGKSGNNGRLGNAEKSIRALRSDMTKVKAEQTKMQIKLALITGTSSLAGGGIVAILSRLWA